jgi:hypothetical protein
MLDSIPPDTYPIKLQGGFIAATAPVHLAGVAEAVALSVGVGGCLGFGPRLLAAEAVPGHGGAATVRVQVEVVLHGGHAVRVHQFVQDVGVVPDLWGRLNT